MLIESQFYFNLLGGLLVVIFVIELFDTALSANAARQVAYE